MKTTCCTACYRQLGATRLDLPHQDLRETATQKFGAGFWGWSETSFVCSVCEQSIQHTNSKTHPGACWTRSDARIVRVTGL